MGAEAFIDFPPSHMGPTWDRGEDGRFVLPVHTLGWEIAGWSSEYLLNPRSPIDNPEPWRFTNEQLRFLLWWYAVDAQGRFVYRYGVLQRLKGWGKDPFLAVISLVEMCGPSRFSHWDEEGQPVGAPHPAAWVQVAAVAVSQTRNTMTMFPLLMSEHFKAEYQVEASQEIIRANGGRVRIEAVTSSYRALEGGRSTFVLLNETQHWVAGNQGIKMYEALALDTPIPTPGGVTTMGALREGDTIFGSSGEQVTVTGAHEVQHGRRCYRAKLANGASVVASDGHLWLAKPKGSGSVKFKVWTTQEMVEDGRDFLVPRAPVRLSGAVVLPLDPYILGAWLGDGTSRTPDIAIGEADVTEMTAELERRGASLTRKKVPEGACPMFSFTNRSRGATRESTGTPEARALRGLPCFGPGRKHIPDLYLHAGTEQRKELLRGLMDTDGCFTQGLCVFSSATERLSRNVFTLALSLGLSPHIGKYAEVWRVTFGANGFNPFSLPRKASAVRFRKSPKNIGISFKEVESVPVRCISVDAEDRLFIAGEGVVTHNTIDGNTTKGGNRYLAITNAYLPGEDSVAERMRMAYVDILEGRAPDFGSLYDTLEAHPKTGLDPDSLRMAIPLIRGDAWWINPDDVIASVMKSDIAPSRSRRMWLNQVVADEDALYEESDWDELYRPGAHLLPGDQVVLGFDGGLKDDATALVAIRVSDGLVQALLVEERPQDWGVRDKDAPRWEVNRELVDAAIHAAFKEYDVVAFFSDVALWESYVSDWSAAYGPRLKVRAGESNAIAWDMRSSHRAAKGNELFMRVVLDRKIIHGGARASKLNLALRRHMLNARRHETTQGLSFRKESKDSPKKVDGYAALVAAYSALDAYRQRGKHDKPRANQAWFF